MVCAGGGPGEFVPRLTRVGFHRAHYFGAARDHADVCGVRAPGECAGQLFCAVGGTAQTQEPCAAAESAIVGNPQHAQLDGAAQPAKAAGDCLIGNSQDLRDPSGAVVRPGPLKETRTSAGRVPVPTDGALHGCGCWLPQCNLIRHVFERSAQVRLTASIAAVVDARIHSRSQSPAVLLGEHRVVASTPTPTST